MSCAAQAEVSYQGSDLKSLRSDNEVKLRITINHFVATHTGTITSPLTASTELTTAESQHFPPPVYKAHKVDS